jgi:hypothetical protein
MSAMLNHWSTFILLLAPNGWRYAPSGVLVGGTRQRHFAGTNFKPRKLPDCPEGVRTLSLRAAVPPL